MSSLVGVAAGLLAEGRNEDIKEDLRDELGLNAEIELFNPNKCIKVLLEYFFSVRLLINLRRHRISCTPTSFVIDDVPVPVYYCYHFSALNHYMYEYERF